MIEGKTKENIHYWHCGNIWDKEMNYCDIPKIGLKCFKTWDDTINFLYLNNFKTSAKEINQCIKK